MQHARSLAYTISLLLFLILAMVVLQACSGGDGDTNSNTTPLPTVCANVAGVWSATEDVTVTCTLAGQPETDTLHGTGQTTIVQNGCAIS